MIAMNLILAVVGGLIIFSFYLSMTILIPLAILIFIDYLIFTKGISRLLKNKSLSFLGVFLSLVIIAPTLFVGYATAQGLYKSFGIDSIRGIKTLKSEDLSDGYISYKIKFTPYSKKKIIKIKKYVSDENTNTAKLVFNEKCSFEDGDIGQVAEKDEFSKAKTYRPCFFEYKISSKNDQLNGKTLRIGLLDKKGVPIRAEIIKDKDSWPNGTIDQIIDSKNYYVQFR